MAGCRLISPGPEFGYHGLRSLFGVLDDSFLGAGRPRVTSWPNGPVPIAFAAPAPRRCNCWKASAASKCPNCGHERLSAHLAGHDGAGAQGRASACWPCTPTRRTSATPHWPASSRPVNQMEEAIHREVFEEVGLRVHNLQVLRQPVVAVPAFADDCLHRRLPGWRHPPRSRAKLPTPAGSAPDDEWPDLTDQGVDRRAS